MKQLQSEVKKGLDKHPNSRVFFNNSHISYKELSQLIDRFKAFFKDQNLQPHSCIVIALPKSVEALAAQLACLSSNYTYVPVDAHAPQKRIDFIAENCKAQLILHQQPNNQILHTGIANIGYKVLHTRRHDGISEACTCILFTSGSTGHPKGVMISDNAMHVFVSWARGILSLSEEDTLTSIAPFYFDLSVFDIYASITVGANLWLLTGQEAANPKWFLNGAKKIKPTVLYATPSWLNITQQFNCCLPDLAPRLVLFAGEVFAVDAFKQLRQQWPSSVYYNFYGPTESNVCTFYKLSEEMPDPIPIGKACPYAELIIDSSNELLIGGDSLMLGYLDHPMPTTVQNDRQYYHSGDVVAMQNDNIVYKGRADRMIKRNGYRIEPAEIEMILNQNPDITACAAVMKEEKLCVFYTGKQMSIITLKKYSSENLLSYMIPNNFTYLDKLPLTRSHKIDYRALKSIV